MDKKWDWLLTAVLTLFILTIVAVSVNLIFEASEPKTAEDNPAKLIAKIERFIIAKGQSKAFNEGSADEGTTYSTRFYLENSIYEVEIFDYRNGKLSFSIGTWFATVNFDDIKTPADVIARGLIYGYSRPRIWFESHLYVKDRKSGKLTIFQTFEKPLESGYVAGFTREERDLGKKAGVVNTILDDGEVSVDGSKWRKATAEELADANEIYLMHLKTVLAHLEHRVAR